MNLPPSFNGSVKPYHEKTIVTLKKVQEIEATISTADFKSLINTLGKELSKQINDNSEKAEFIRFKYFQYLSEEFIHAYYNQINEKDLYNFFAVLKASNLIIQSEIEELYSDMQTLVLKDYACELSKERVPIYSFAGSKENLNQLDQILKNIIQKHNIQVKNSENVFEEVWEELCDLVHKIDFSSMNIDDVELVKYGSSASKFQLPSSDLDVTLLIRYNVDKQEILSFIHKNFEKFKEKGQFNGELTLVCDDKLLFPRLTFEYKDVSFDLTINNIIGVQNTKLLDIYASLDSRCYELGILIKLWTKANGIHNSANLPLNDSSSHEKSLFGYLPSFGNLIMVIGFLQLLEKPILPSIQQMGDKKEKVLLKRNLDLKKEDYSKTDISFETDLEKIKKSFKEYGENSQPLSVLLLSFFHWLLNMIERTDVTISIKDRCLVPRKKKFVKTEIDEVGGRENYVYSINDPFDITNDVGECFQKHEKDLLKLFFDTISYSIKVLHGKVTGENSKHDVERLFKSEES